MDKVTRLKQTVSQLEKEIAKNNEESDQLIISLDACISRKDETIRQLKEQNAHLRETIERLKKQNRSRNVLDNLFGH